MLNRILLASFAFLAMLSIQVGAQVDGPAIADESRTDSWLSYGRTCTSSKSEMICKTPRPVSLRALEMANNSDSPATRVGVCAPLLAR